MLDWILVGFVGAFIAAIVLSIVLLLAASISGFTFVTIALLSICGIGAAIIGLVTEEVSDDD